MADSCDDTIVVINSSTDCAITVAHGSDVSVCPKTEEPSSITIPTNTEIEIRHNPACNRPNIAIKQEMGLEVVNNLVQQNSIDVIQDSAKDVIIECKGSGGGLPEAPVDGQLYGRRDRNWEVVVGGSSPSNLVLDFSAANIIDGGLVIGSTIGSKRIQETVLEIFEPFNNNLGITVGTNVAQAILMSMSENDPDIIGSYYKSNNLLPNGTDVFLAFFNYITAPTEGRGQIVIYFN